MAIVKTSDYVEFYRYLANTEGVHALAGRGDETAATEYANVHILECLELTADDRLLDIGCGDGCLLRMAAGKVRTRVGIVPNVEEYGRIHAAWPEVVVRVGIAQRLPVESESFSRIVCNSVIPLLESETEVSAALREIARVAEKGARICVGELPAADELSKFGKYRGNSVFGFLVHESGKGVRPFIHALRSVSSAWVGRSSMALSSARIFYAAPEKFIRMAEDCGLRYVTHFKYQRLDRTGEVIESPFRYNYIFEK